MERTRPAATSWDTRAFLVHQPLDATTCRAPSRASPQQEDLEQRPGAAAPAAAAATATARSTTQLHAPAPRFTIRPPSRLLSGKYTQRERCSPPPPNLLSATSSSCFDSSSAYGTQGIISGSDSDASMDAEVASLTSGRVLGNGVEGLLRMVDAPSRPRASQPRIRDAESAVSLFALLTPSPIDGERAGQQQREASRAAAAVGDELPAEREGGVWGVEPDAKRRRTFSSKVPDS